MMIYKYNGCGNDFILLDYDGVTDYSQLAIQLCGKENFDTDGLIAVKTEPLEMIYYNKDGSRAPMCGNGIRCFSRYVRDQGIIQASQFDVHTLAGIIKVEILNQDPFYCEATIGSPDYSTDKLAVEQEEPIIDQELMIHQKGIKITSLFMGTIHTIVFVEDALAELTRDVGEQICDHPLFKEKTNVNFVQILNNEELIVRTYERGVGWTLACGTGCCAAYVVAKDHGYVSEPKATVHLELGDLIISGEKQIKMKGPAVREWSREWEEN